MITSTSNARIRALVHLKKSAKDRAAEDLFLVEGAKMFSEVPKELLKEAYVSESFAKEHNVPGAEVVTDAVFQYLSDTQSPQGIFAAVKMQHYRPADLLTGGKPLVMVLENLQDPGNLGTIIRTAEGAGVTGILMSRGTADLYNPKVTRSTMGSIFRMPFYYSEDLGRDILWLKKEGVRCCAAHLTGKNTYDKENFCGATAFLIGNESRGLSDEISALADVRVRIPMCGKVESLNAAVASAILMYEARRQRG